MANTRALLAAVPRAELAPPARAEQLILPGELPWPANPPAGCHFHPRCPHVTDRCRSEAPRLREIAPGDAAAFHLGDAS